MCLCQMHGAQFREKNKRVDTMFLRATVVFVFSVILLSGDSFGLEFGLDENGSIIICSDEEVTEFFGQLESNEKFRDDMAERALDLSFWCADKHISEIPRAIRYLKNLHRLDLAGCEVNYLPEELGELSALQDLQLHNNPNLSTLPDSIGSLSNLEVLDCHYNGGEDFGPLEAIPATIGKLKKLRELKIGNNRVKRLPDSICDLESLEKLQVGNNWILELPAGLGRLKNLKKLVASLNCFKSLPVLQPGDFASIEEIHLHNNSNLSSFPWDVSKMPFLKLLALNCPKEYRQKNFLIHLSVAEWMRVDGHCYSGPREDDVFMSDAWCTIS